MPVVDTAIVSTAQLTDIELYTAELYAMSMKLLQLYMRYQLDEVEVPLARSLARATLLYVDRPDAHYRNQRNGMHMRPPLHIRDAS